MKESNRQYGKAVEEKNRRDGKSCEREESSKRQSNEREDTSCQRSTIGVAIVSTINPFNALVKLLCACCATCFRAGPPSSDVISAEITNNRLRSCVFRNIPRQHSFADAGYRTNASAIGGVLYMADQIQSCSSSSSIYQIPNTEHMAYRLVRTLVYKRGVVLP